jgi:alkylated DNA repair protein alkB family protein 6
MVRLYPLVFKFPFSDEIFKPHEDGPSYHPVVATISLGSHAVFHYYNYKSEDPLAASESTNQSSDTGRVVNPVPILSVLLEPRSVIITTSSLYTSHLHGIQELHEDVIAPTSAADTRIPLVVGLDVPIANWQMLTGENERRIVRDGGTLRRGTRYSLTCRDVEKVAGGTTFLRP